MHICIYSSFFEKIKVLNQMKMKKINWLTTLLLAVMVSFAACTGEAGQTEETDAEASAQEVVETVAEIADTTAMADDTSAMKVDSVYEEQEASNDDDAN